MSLGLGKLISSVLTDPLGTANKFLGGVIEGGIDAVTGGGKQKEAQPGSPMTFGSGSDSANTDISF